MTIINTTTGEKFRSYKAAAKSQGGTETSGIKRACKAPHVFTAYGQRWARLK